MKGIKAYLIFLIQLFFGMVIHIDKDISIAMGLLAAIIFLYSEDQ